MSGFTPTWRASDKHVNLALSRTYYLLKNFTSRRLDLLLANAYLQGVSDAGQVASDTTESELEPCDCYGCVTMRKPCIHEGNLADRERA